MKELNDESFPKELRRIQSLMLEVEAGLSYLEPRSKTFENELPMFEKRVTMLSNYFAELLSYMPRFKTDKVTARNQVRFLIDLNNKVINELDQLKGMFGQKKTQRIGM